MNLYHAPETLGLELIVSADFGEEYRFDIVALWRRKSDGVFLMAEDSGCSCPMPFEGHTLESLEVATTGRLWDALMSRGDIPRAMEAFESAQAAGL